MEGNVFGSDLWKPALEKYGEATGMTVRLFGADAREVLGPVHPTPLADLFREYAFEPGLFVECARRCLAQTGTRPAVFIVESHGPAVVGASLLLEGEIVGVAVAGYALLGFSQVVQVQRWAKSAGVPFGRLWDIARRQAPVPERRLLLHGELLQVLGDALLRENFRTRQYSETVVELRAAAAAKDEFLAMLSHELRTPLTPILAWAALLKQNNSPEQARQAGEAIERSALLESRMVNDLLDVNLIEHGTISLDLKTHDLSALVRSAAESCAADLEKNAIRLQFVDAGKPLFVEADAGRLQQVFRNIFSNAIKFTPREGNIRVTLSREANTALVAVADTGAGIASQFLPFVFDKFRQQERAHRRAHEGLGIGLTLVKRLTELHKGTVIVASEGAGRGTEVAVRLPLAAREAPVGDAAAGVAKPSAKPLAGLSILVVEDSDDTRESLQLLLEFLGAEVSVARDGSEALDVFRDAQPDVVLCDLRMPRMDGYEFIRELQRGSSARAPVVAMSGLASDKDRQRTREAGFAGHIKKPFDEAALVAAVGAALNHRQARSST